MAALAERPDRASPRPAGSVTFHQDIAPILRRHCVECHHPGEAGPFDLVSFQNARDHAADIVTTTARRYMPPWLPDRSGPALVGERGLTEEEISLLRQWAADGTPEGRSRGGGEPEPQWSSGWQLGPPDFIAEMPEAYTLPADGRDVYRNFVIPMPSGSRRYVRAYEFKPGTKVLHHVFLRFDRSQQSRRLDQQDTQVGFGGMSLPPSATSPGGYFLSWQPGRGATRSPAGLAWSMEPGADLVLQAHMQPSGKPERVKARIGFYFTEEPPTNTPSKIALSSIRIDIPAGATNVSVEDSYVLPVDVDLLAVLPHAHYLAREIRGWVQLPDGQSRPLLTIRDWDFNWQSDYRYQTPVHLPKGTRVSMRMRFDNSAANPRNPHQPPVAVGYGQQSTDEMAELWMQFLTRTPEDQAVLDRDYGRRILGEVIEFNRWALSKNPTNAHAHIQLGKALVAMGEPAEAMVHFRRGLRIDPRDEEGHYNIGLLVMDANPLLAEKAFLQVLALNPENFQARNNLGLVLMRQARFDEAEGQFRRALEHSPGDAIVLQNLEILKQQRGKP